MALPQFLNELSEAVTLSASIMKKDAVGPANVKHVIATVATIYSSMTPMFAGKVGEYEVVAYSAIMPSGLELTNVGYLSRNSKGLVTQITTCFSPLPAILELSKILSEKLGNELPEIFLES